MFRGATRSFVDSLRRAAFIAGAEWRSANRELSTDEVERAIELTFDERRADLRRQVAEEVRALAELEIAPLPSSVLDEYEALGEEAPASLPFFSEAFLYPLVGKEDARGLLACFEELCKVAGVPDPPLEDPEIEEMANRLRAGCADAYRAGVLFAEQEPKANWMDYDREARNRYPFGENEPISVPLLPYAFLDLATSDLESAPLEAAGLYTKIRPRFFSSEHLDALLGKGVGTPIRDALFRIGSLLGVDLEVVERERDQRLLREAEEEAFRRARFHARMQFRKTGQHRLGDLGAAERAELRKAYPYRARVLVGRKSDGSGGTMVEVPFARSSGRTIEVPFEILESGVDVAIWSSKDAELFPADESD